MLKRNREKMMAQAVCLLVWVIAPNIAVLADEGKLRGGDIVSLRLLGVPQKDQESVSGRYTVVGEGTLRLPYLEKEIAAAGLRPSVVAKSIERLYVLGGIYTRPTVLIGIDHTNPSRFVTVAGEVRSPGDVPYRHDLTLLSALSARGGFTDFANSKKVQLIRALQVSTHDLRRVTTTPTSDIPVLPGDRILVPQVGVFKKGR